MADADLFQGINRRWASSNQSIQNETHNTCKHSGKGELNIMNFNQDDTSSQIKFTPRKDPDTFSSNTGEMGTRPAGDPKSSKNFQKLLSKDSGNKEDIEDQNAEMISEEVSEEAAMMNAEAHIIKKKPVTSLFELSSARGTSSTKGLKKPEALLAKSDKIISDPDKDTVQSDDDIPQPESPNEMFAKLSSKDTRKHARDIHSDAHTTLVDKPIEAPEKKEKFTSRFSTEQSDLSYVNPLALNTQPVHDITLSTDKPTLPVTHIQDIIDQMVDKVVEMKDQGRTETTITLKHPPLFAGADLIVTAFDSAKGEFNLTFQNLTQAAKHILDMHANQQSLLLALEQKGYAVHIVTTTTLVENPIIETSTPQDRQRNPDQQRQQQQQQNKNT